MICKCDTYRYIFITSQRDHIAFPDHAFINFTPREDCVIFVQTSPIVYCWKRILPRNATVIPAIVLLPFFIYLNFVCICCCIKKQGICCKFCMIFYTMIVLYMFHEWS